MPAFRFCGNLLVAAGLVILFAAALQAAAALPETPLQPNFRD